MLQVVIRDRSHDESRSMSDLITRQRRFVDEYQTGRKVDVADELIADDFVNHSTMPPFPPNKDGVKALFAMFHDACPDFRAEIHDMLVDGDKVVTYKTFHGTHEGEMMGVPGTGKEFAVDVMDIVRYRDGQVVEHWNVVNQVPLLQALGVIPS
jgi:steroid delta-isomerase-like uncharacterized protein